MPNKTNPIDIDRTLERITVAKAILEVVHGLVEESDYEKEDAAKDLMEFLTDYHYLSEVASYKGF